MASSASQMSPFESAICPTKLLLARDRPNTAQGVEQVVRYTEFDGIMQVLDAT